MCEEEEYYDAFPQGMIAREFSINRQFDDFEAFIETCKLGDLKMNKEKLSHVKRWRSAYSITKLCTQLDNLFPGRNKNKDGIFGDRNLCPAYSDHSPTAVVNGLGVVTGIDITHDPVSGCSVPKILDNISSSRDKRIKYILHNGRILRSYCHEGKKSWTWHRYEGLNKHKNHTHISVLSVDELFDDSCSWHIL